MVDFNSAKYYIVDKVFRSFSRTSIWHKFASKYLGYLHFRFFGYPQMPLSLYEEKIRPLLEDGEEKKCLYTFVSCDSKSLATMLIRGVSGSYYSHNGIFLDSKHVMHMRSEGVVVQHVLDLMKECDNFAVCKYVMPNEETYKSAVSRREFIKKHKELFSYDYQQEIVDEYLKNRDVDDIFLSDFKNNVKSPITKLYCSELNYLILSGNSHNVRSHKELGRSVYEPDDNYSQCDEVVFEYRTEGGISYSYSASGL